MAFTRNSAALATAVLVVVSSGVVAQNPTMQSITTYSDSACSVGARALSAAAGLCYNSSRGDFIVLDVTSHVSQAWLATQEFQDAQCTQGMVNTVAMANTCAKRGGNTYGIDQISQSSWTLFMYADCDATCHSCATNATATAGQCVQRPDKSSYVKPIPLGIGSGAYSFQFFKSTDGSCRWPSQAALVPDSSCLGAHALQVSSLQAGGRGALKPRHSRGNRP